MNLENSIKDVISQKLVDGTIEKVVSEQLEEGIKKAVGDLFGNWGECTKIIENQIKSVMVPYLENYDYSKYIVKMDKVLVDILENTTVENKKMLENFKDLISTDKRIKTIKVSELFDRWCEYVAKNVDTNNLSIEYDDGPSYESVEVSYEFEDDYSDRSWIRSESGKIIFECEHDEEMNVCIEIYRYKNINKEKVWNFNFSKQCDLKSLRYLDEFSVFLMSLSQNGVEIELDEISGNDYIRPEEEPEASFN